MIRIVDATGRQHAGGFEELSVVIGDFPEELWLRGTFDGVAYVDNLGPFVLTPTEDRRFLVSWFDGDHGQWVIRAKDSRPSTGTSIGHPGGEPLIVHRRAVLTPDDTIRFLVDLEARPPAAKPFPEWLEGTDFTLDPLEEVMICDDAPGTPGSDLGTP